MLIIEENPMTLSYPGESPAYRSARAALLKEEIALRAQSEKVAALRRSLPSGGAVATDYEFTDLKDRPVKLSSLFTTPRATLALYSLMYRPDADVPCPMCVSMLDGLVGQAEHIGQVIDLAVVSAATPAQLRALSELRGWGALRLISAAGNSYQTDYHGETADGAQLPMMNVFRKMDGAVTHFWGSEGFFADVPGHPRHVDQLWPLWNVLDLTPDGRGEDWYPALSYG
jgi:predicted dithiol-disulfide oxidoreductase (DUF899 family)